MIGAIAEAFYKEIPLEILRQVKKKPDSTLWKKTMEFYNKFGIDEINEQLRSLDTE